LESLPAHSDHTTARRENKNDRRERPERSSEGSLLGGLRNNNEGELTAMAEAFRAAARQRSSKDDNETAE
jgi:small subunit ribosomal protein S1